VECVFPGKYAWFWGVNKWVYKPPGAVHVPLEGLSRVVYISVYNVSLAQEVEEGGVPKVARSWFARRGQARVAVGESGGLRIEWAGFTTNSEFGIRHSELGQARSVGR
jgi:hypothetical protein